LICEDAWFEAPARLAKQAGAQLLAVINASPFHLGKGYEREEDHGRAGMAQQLRLVYAHLVADKMKSFSRAIPLPSMQTQFLGARAHSFVEDVFAVTLETEVKPFRLFGPVAPVRSEEADLWDALVLGVRDYIGKNRFPGALLGLLVALIRLWCWPLRSMR